MSGMSLPQMSGRFCASRNKLLGYGTKSVSDLTEEEKSFIGRFCTDTEFENFLEKICQKCSISYGVNSHRKGGRPPIVDEDIAKNRLAALRGRPFQLSVPEYDDFITKLQEETVVKRNLAK